MGKPKRNTGLLAPRHGDLGSQVADLAARFCARCPRLGIANLGLVHPGEDGIGTRAGVPIYEDEGVPPGMVWVGVAARPARVPSAPHLPPCPQCGALGTYVMYHAPRGRVYFRCSWRHSFSLPVADALDYDIPVRACACGGYMARVWMNRADWYRCAACGHKEKA